MKTSELEIELLTVYTAGLYVKEHVPLVWNSCREMVVDKLDKVRRRKKDE